MRERRAGLLFLFFFLAGGILFISCKSYAAGKRTIRVSKPKTIFVGEETTIKVYNIEKRKVSFLINRRGLDKISIVKKSKNSIVIKGKRPGEVHLTVRFKRRKSLRTTIKVEKNINSLHLSHKSMLLSGGNYGTIAAFLGKRCVSRGTRWTVSDRDGLYLGTFGGDNGVEDWENNTVYGIKPGTYTIYAEYRGKKAACQVTVKKTSDRWIEMCRLKERADQYQKTIKRAMKESVKPGMTDLEKAKALAEWLCRNVDYDNSGKKNSEEEAFVDGLTACQGYAEAYNVLMNRAGIYCCVVHGRTYPRKKSKKNISHAWNIVYIDGAWYHVDVTWMDRGKKIRYKSFMKSSAYFAKRNPRRKKWTVEYYNFPELIIYLHTRPETGKKYDKIKSRMWKKGTWKKYLEKKIRSGKKKKKKNESQVHHANQILL